MPAHSHVMIDLAGPSLSEDERSLLQNHHIGGICLFRRNLKDRYQVAELTQALREICGEQLIIGIDQEGGTVVRATDVPYSIGNMALGSANDTKLTESIAAMNARGLKSIGINVNFAPVADVNNNPRNPVIGDRSFASTAVKVAKHVTAFIRGSQSAGIAATIKHFPGHGDTAVDSHHDLPRLDVNLERLNAVELVPFKEGIAAGVACVMSYHGVVTALDPSGPASLSKNVMTHFLRGKLGFQGVSFTDALEMQAIGRTYGAEESVVRALAAGVDMGLYNVHSKPIKTHELIFNAVDRALQDGRLDEARLVASRQRLDRLAQHYPPHYHPDHAWQDGDKALIQQAIHQSVCRLGHPINLSANASLQLIASSQDVGGSASDMSASPALALADKLESRGLDVRRVFYHPDDVSPENVLAQLGSTNIFVSTSRQRLSEAEVKLANAIASHSQAFTHIALWNPYSCLDIPQPAILSFGFQDAALERTIDVLLGATSEGSVPFDVAR